MDISKPHSFACFVATICFARLSVFGYALNWTANCLNQYTECTYDADGNMTQFGDWTYTYDAANRLKTVSSNDALLVTNFYDAKSRRAKKVTPEATTSFFYDGWNLIEERIAYTSGTSTTIRYFWGKDLSGTIQGASGVDGLLYLTINGIPYIPCYDSIGNITRYLNSTGNTVAQYTYDVFGKIVAQSGSLAHIFRHRFSTKSFDADVGLYYYGYRCYHPDQMRWLNRDLIEEKGGHNLYMAFQNNPLFFVDLLGLEVRIIKHLLGEMPPLGWSKSAVAAETFFISPNISVVEVLGVGGKVRFKVILNPEDSILNVYFKGNLSPDEYMVAMWSEQQHIDSYVNYDNDIHHFKEMVEQIHDCRKAAYDTFDKYRKWLLEQKEKCLYYNNVYLDGQGGIHGH